jgi:hypothetical protein
MRRHLGEHAHGDGILLHPRFVSLRVSFPGPSGAVPPTEIQQPERTARLMPMIGSSGEPEEMR